MVPLRGYTKEVMLDHYFPAHPLPNDKTFLGHSFGEGGMAERWLCKERKRRDINIRKKDWKETLLHLVTFNKQSLQYKT